MKYSNQITNKVIYWETGFSIMVYIMVQGITRSTLAVTIISSMIFAHEIEQLDLTIECWIVLLELITKTLLSNDEMQASNESRNNQLQLSPILVNAFVLAVLSQNSSIKRPKSIKIKNICIIMCFSIIHFLIINGLNVSTNLQNILPFIGMVLLILKLVTYKTYAKSEEDNGQSSVKSQYKNFNNNEITQPKHCLIDTKVVESKDKSDTSSIDEKKTEGKKQDTQKSSKSDKKSQISNQSEKDITKPNLTNNNNEQSHL